MTYSDTVAEPPVGFHGNDNAFLNFHSPNDHFHKLNKSFLTLKHFTCDRTKSVYGVNKFPSLTNPDMLATCATVQIDSTSSLPVTGLLTKYWKSTSVLCDEDGAESIVRRPSKVQMRKKSSVRSCERGGSELKTNGELIIAVNRNGCVNGSLLSDKRSDRLNDGNLRKMVWDNIGTQTYKVDDTTPRRENGSFNGCEVDSWRHSVYSDSDGSDTPKSSAHATSVTSSNGFHENQRLDMGRVNNQLERPVGQFEKMSETDCRISPSFEDTNDAYDRVKQIAVNDSKSDTNSPVDDVEDGHAEEEDSNRTNLIVNYLPQNMTQEEIRSLFATIGEVDSCKLIKDKNTNQNLGYGFVNYVNSKDAERAITELNGMQLQNKTIKVSLARPSSESIKGANLYISGLPTSMTQEELEKLFNQCGRIITSRILYDSNTGQSRGVGFIRFDQRIEAELAIKQLNGIIPADGTDPITVKLANSPASATSSSNSLIAVNGHSFPPYLRDIGRQHGLNSFGKDVTGLNKPNPNALAMMLLHQISSQTGTPLSQANQLLRFTPVSTSTALLPFPVQHNAHRTLRPTTLPRVLAHGPRKMPASGSASLNNQLHSGPPLPSPQQHSRFTEHESVGRATVPLQIPMGHQGPANPSSVVPGIFGNQSHFLNAPLQAQMFYPRYRYPAQNRVVGIPTAPNGMAVNGYMPQALTTNFFTTYPLSECNGHFNQNGFLSYPPNTIANAASIGLPYTELTNFNVPIDHSGGPHLISPVPVMQGYSHVTSAVSPYAGPSLFCLFVSNLPPEADDSTLWRLFGPYGAVRSVKVVREAGSGKCKGFGFVNMLNYTEAVLAIQQLNNYALGNRILHVAFKNQCNPSNFQQ